VTWTDDDVAVEFVGKARAVRTKYTDASLRLNPLMKALVADAEAPYTTPHRNHRGRLINVSQRHLERVADRWLALDRTCCLSQTISLSGLSLEILDIRLTGSTMTRPDWDQTENGICIVRNTLRLGKTRVFQHGPVQVGISLHGLARWFSRRFGPTDDDALLVDLTVLAVAAPGLIAAGCPDVLVPAPNGGAWRGRMVTDGNHDYCDIRTFF
jgi:hypothetical protein